ncbi:oligosaccharide flippase family protein [Lacticaseibacillus pantheris]|uniref:oligosaccharide flippase family protein n=1 Tax=Lacticaseibacillus pantheris TaxID=171523 RepID=UPI0034E1C73F
MKIVKNYLYNVGYQVFILIVPLLTTPYISRVLGSYGVGVNAYTNSVVTYFVLFGSIGVTLYGNRTIAYERDDFKKTQSVVLGN